MMILASLLIVLLLPPVVVGLSYTRLRQGLLWVAVVVGTFISGILLILAGRQLPVETPLLNWEPAAVFSSSPAFLMDETSFPFAIAVIVLALAILLADVVHYRELNIRIWASSLTLGGMGLIGVLAGNPLTLLLAWAAADIAEIAVLLEYISESKVRERMVIDFSLRLGGTILLVVAMLQAQSQGTAWDFQAGSPDIGIYLLLAAILRLGVIPIRRDYFQDINLNRGLGTALHLFPVVASIVLLIRVASIGLDEQWLTLVVACAAIMSLFSAWMWFRAKHELRGRPDWILSLLCFVVIAASSGLEMAGLAWGLALVFSGAILFLYSARRRFVMIIVLFGGVSFSALPFTPAWAGVELFVATPLSARVVLLVALALLIAGYLQHTRRREPQSDGFERWMWLVYPGGLALLLLTYFALVIYLQFYGLQSISFTGWWYGVLPLVIAAVLIVLTHQRASSALDGLSSWVQRISLSFISRILWWLYIWLGRFIAFLSNLLEGEGGILWALLALILLVVSLSLLEVGSDFGL